MITVIIPAYKATKYIDECLASLPGAEILVGIDRCKETFDHLVDRTDIKTFYFTENVGPFIIKNTLVDEASYDKILFFDSDDILVEGVLDRIEKALDDVDYVKLNYINFTHRINHKAHKMNDAVIAINRPVFNELNGFKPWRCGADTEFAHRLAFNKLKHTVLDDVAYYRRIHGENLTVRKETGYDSPIRKGYMEYIARRQRENNWVNPTHKQTQGYVTYTTTHRGIAHSS
jgi:glycosyltransferase involved in cell wall biosynthesis